MVLSSVSLFCLFFAGREGGLVKVLLLRLTDKKKNSLIKKRLQNFTVSLKCHTSPPFNHGGAGE